MLLILLMDNVEIFVEDFWSLLNSQKSSRAPGSFYYEAGTLDAFWILISDFQWALSIVAFLLQPKYTGIKTQKFQKCLCMLSWGVFFRNCTFEVRHKKSNGNTFLQKHITFPKQTLWYCLHGQIRRDNGSGGTSYLIKLQSLLNKVPSTWQLPHIQTLVFKFNQGHNIET